MPALDHINKDGTKYEIVPEIAPLFNTSTAYAKGDCVIKDAVLYRFKTAHSAGAWNSSEVDAINLSEEVTDLKQDLQEFPNGNYPNMTAGNADQLVSTVFIEDEVPYNFRTAGGSADIGDREYDEIVGVSMPINQLVKSLSNDNWSAESGVTATYDNGVVTISSATSGNGIKHRTHIVTQGHKYFATMSVYGASGLTVAISGIPATSGISIDHTITSANTWQTASKIISCGLSGNMTLYALARGGTYENVKMKDIRITDLTLMLGTQIADYVYGLEQSTAGSGVTWLRHHFPKIFDSGYIPYTAGEMQSVTGLSAHKMTGFNQWDEVWEPGGLSEVDGSKTSNYTYKRSVNYCKCFGGATYFGHSAKGAQLVVYWYDANKTYVGFNVITNTTVVAPANAAYFLARVSLDYFPLAVGDICINLHWDGERDGEYEAYKEYVYPLDDSVTLRGILKLDSSNSLYADGDRYLADGMVERRFGVVDLGTLTWGLSNNGNYFTSNDLPYNAATNNNAVCVKYTPESGINIYNANSDKVFGIAQSYMSSSPKNIAIRDSAYTDAATFKTAMNGVMLVYELATATTETAEPYQTPQIVDDWGTEEYVSTSLVPVGHDTKYANNLRAKLEMSPNSPEENGDYIVRHSNGENEYVALGSTTTIQGILDRLTALENA